MEIESYFRFLLALVFVLGLIALLAALARRWGLGYRVAPMRKDKARRLSISEIMPLDARRRLVLLRRDDVEHLVILGPTGETVVEHGISAPTEESFAEALDAVEEGAKP